MQIVDEKDVLSFGFDLLDPTKIIPEELVPVTPLGSMKLDSNPRNYFAETEQVMVISSWKLPEHEILTTINYSFNLVTSSGALTLPRTLFSKVGFSHTSIHS